MLFQSELIGGFECSSHIRTDGRRLDMVAATRHDEFATRDYKRLVDLGIRTARSGLRWHLIEARPGHYDFSSIETQIDAAQKSGVEVIWDLFHYGYPERLDIFGDDFVTAFSDFTAAFAHFNLQRTGRSPSIVAINEISFFSWAAGQIGHFYPFAHGRGDELKRQLVKAMIAAVHAVKGICPDTRSFAAEPLIHVASRACDPPDLAVEAERYRLSQFQTLDMLFGRMAPELGGSPDLWDAIGINYYPHNQWYFGDREMIDRSSPDYLPLRVLLSEVFAKYGLPMFIAETGAEDEVRADWFRYVMGEYRLAQHEGVDLRGICIYPIVNHPGWMDERHCHNGLWDYADQFGDRQICDELAAEVNSWFPIPVAAKAASA